MPEVLTAPRVLAGDALANGDAPAGRAVLADGAVVIDGAMVRWTGPAAGLPPEFAAAPRTDYPGGTILPGLIDAHVHLGFDGGPRPVDRLRTDSDEQQLVRMLHSARELLGVGVTTARDLGSRAYLGLAVRDAIADGMARGPRMLIAASPVTVTGGHCWFLGGEADSDDDLRRLVRTHHKRGADLIKVMSTGGFMTTGSAPWYAQFSAGQLAIVVEEARRVGKPVAAHAHGIEGIRRAVEAGVSTIEHCSFVTETNERVFSEPLAEAIAAKGIVVCPTVNVNAPYVAQLTGIAIGQHLPAMRDLGVRIIAGTDSGIDNTPHHQYLGGLQYLVSLGFSAAEVIAMATTQAAAALGLGDVTGALAAGLEADLLVVDGDPLADIADLGRLRRVVARGRDYVPDSGRFDVSAPGTPFAREGASIDLTLLTAATRLRRPG
ncbi:MAG TPA: amidohydrolase family protein [Streptosporangiaceae bacterium]